MMTLAKFRKSAKELLECSLVQGYVTKFFKAEKLLLTIRKIRDWATFPYLKKLALLYFST